MNPTSQPAPSANPAGPRKTKRLLAMAITAVAVLAVGIGAWWWLTRDAATEETAATVTVKDSAFEPATIQIKKGQDVTWTNEGQAAHHIYADQSAVPGLDSQEPLNNGDTYTFTFENAGTYYYYDSLNPKLNATVVVE